MVQIPSSNTVRESRHVAIKGIPQHIPDANVRNYFAKFGTIQCFNRQEPIVFISYEEARSAAQALKTDHFDKNTTYQITYYNPEMPNKSGNLVGNNSVSSTPSSARSSSPPQHAEPSPSFQRCEERDGDVANSSPSFRPQNDQLKKPSTSTADETPVPTPSKPKYPRDHWEVPTFKIVTRPKDRIVAIVVYDLKIVGIHEKQLFEELKSFSKTHGICLHIELDATTDPNYLKAKVFYYRLDFPTLKSQRANYKLFGRPLNFKIYFPPTPIEGYDDLTMPSTSRNPPLKSENLHRYFFAIHVQHERGIKKDYYVHRFSIYGTVLQVKILDSPSIPSQQYAVVQFSNWIEAQNALKDLDMPKPLVSSSVSAKRLILFYLPQLTKKNKREHIMFHLRMISTKIVHIEMDWMELRAILTFHNYEDAHDVFKVLKAKKYNFPDNTVIAVDYCPDPLNDYLLQHRQRVLDFAAAGEAMKANKAKTRSLNDREPTPSRAKKRRKSSPGVRREKNDEESSESESESESSSSEESVSDEKREDDDDDDDDDRNPENAENLDPKEDYEDNDSMFYHDNEPSTSNQDNHENRRVPPSPSEEEDANEDLTERRKITPAEFIFPDTSMTRMINRMQWKCFEKLEKLPLPFPKRIDEISNRNCQARVAFEKLTGRPIPRFTNEDLLKTMTIHTIEPSRDAILDFSTSDIDTKMREWKRMAECGEIEEFKCADAQELLKIDGVTSAASTSRSSGRPSLDETRSHRMSFDSSHSHHPHELTQRSQSLSIGPMTPVTPYHTQPPLQINTSQPGPSQPAAVTTPRSSQPTMQPSPVSRHGSMSSTGRPASIQELRHRSVIFPPDISIPPPPIPPSNDELMLAPKGMPPTRRSSETIVPLKSPPFGKQPIQQLMSMPLAPPPGLAGLPCTPTGTHSVSSSTSSTPRHSISGTPGHHESMTPKTYQNPKSIRPEKVQVRHDSMSKPGPSTSASALQARSQSVSIPELPKKTTQTAPPVRDAGIDLYEKIMSNTPNMGLKKLPRIEKKPSALLHLQNQQNANSGAAGPSTPTSSSVGMLLKDKEKEKRRREREAERERDARKEMKKKETKEERHKRKEMERAKREEEERRERKREKQRMKEKEERKREKEKEKRGEKEKERERRRAEKEKSKKKKKHRKENDSEYSDSTSNDDLMDSKKSTKEMTQEEKDHRLALLLSEGGTAENLRSRRRPEKKSNHSFEKLRQKNQNSAPVRRVLIESSDDDENGEDEEEKEKSGDSSGEGSENETFMPPPQMAPSSLTPHASKEGHKSMNHREREKGELSSTSEDESENRNSIFENHNSKDVKENRKRQKSVTNYSSDDHERKNAAKKKRHDSDEKLRDKIHEKDDQKARKRKHEHRKSSEDERNKAKRDFRDVPLEDVSDEEEAEDSSRVRRPSTSSNASNATEKKESAAKTPLRVKTPAGTPLMSPKILSPKIISPKPSTSSTKRPSLTDHEPPLMSPQPRIRTTSSTSTATTASKPEAAAPEKAASPPVTAKSSVSSMDELAIRDELSSTSAVGSPMSATGRPMVRTKAAMKAFHSSPPKKQNSSSSPHDSSDTSSSSASSSSDDTSEDEEVVTQNEPPVTAPALTCMNNDSDSQSSLQVQVPISAPPDESEVDAVAMSPSRKESTPVLEVLPQSPVIDEALVSSTHDEPVEEKKEHYSAETKKEEEEEEDSAISDPLNHSQIEEKELAKQISDESEAIVEEKPSEETMKEPVSSSPKMSAEHDATEDSVLGEDKVPEQEMKSPKREPPVTHSLISDQETDQAVQSINMDSIFDEEEYPQYPDFQLPKERKDSNEKDRSEIIEKTFPPQVVDESADSGDSSSIRDTNHIDQRSDTQMLTTLENNDHSQLRNGPSRVVENAKNDENVKENDPVHVIKENSQTAEEPIVLEEEMPMEVAAEQEIVVDTETITIEDDEVEVVSDPAGKPEKPQQVQTPNPKLIPNDVNNIVRTDQSSRIETPLAVHHNKYQHVQAPFQPPPKPLEVSVSQNNSQNRHPMHQVIQPSPRAAAAPDAQTVVGQPVSVVQQRQPEKPSPRAPPPPPPPAPPQQQQQQQQTRTQTMSLQDQETQQQFIMMLANLQPHLKNSGVNPEIIHSILAHIQQGNVANMPPELLQPIAVLMAQQQQLHANNISEQKRLEKVRRDEEEAKRRQAEHQEAERRRKENEQKRALGFELRKRVDEGLQIKMAATLLSDDARNALRQAWAPNGVSMSNGILHQSGNTRPSSVASLPAVPAAHVPISPVAHFTSSAPQTVSAVSDYSRQKCYQQQAWFYSHFPNVWSGALGIKTNSVPIKLHFVNGNSEFLTTVLGRSGNAPQRDALKITQRLRLDNGQVEHLHGVLTDPQYACCVAFVESTSPEDLTNHENIMQTNFIEYLKSKNIAGISSLSPADTFTGARVHVFPPGELVEKYFAELAPALYSYLFDSNMKYLFVAFTNDRMEPNMTQAPVPLVLDAPPN